MMWLSGTPRFTTSLSIGSLFIESILAPHAFLTVRQIFGGAYTYHQGEMRGTAVNSCASAQGRAWNGNAQKPRFLSAIVQSLS